MSLSAAHSAEDVSALVDALHKCRALEPPASLSEGTAEAPEVLASQDSIVLQQASAASLHLTSTMTSAAIRADASAEREAALRGKGFHQHSRANGNADGGINTSPASRL